MNRQALLFSKPKVEEPKPKFDGRTFDDKLDGPRLTKQLDRVRGFMLAIFPAWKSVYEISEALEQKYGDKFPTQSVSARLRDLRKKKFGGYIVERKRREIGEFIERRSGGVFEYLVFSEKNH